jgi:peptidoglycan/LPS O-acetylase OafA/YrhL
MGAQRGDSIVTAGGTAGIARLARLDGLRGIAACGVCAWHLQIFYPGGLGSTFDGLVGWLYVWGWAFVDLFFVISGYIFAHVYLGSAGLRTRRQLADFAVARVARLYPLHLAMLLIVLVLDWGRPENTAEAFLAHLFMLQGIVPHANEGFDGPSWSISIEVLCYLLFALAACSGPKLLARMTTALVAMAVLQLAFKGLPGGAHASDDIVRGILGFFVGQLLWRYRDTLARIPVLVLVPALGLGGLAAAWPHSPVLPLDLVAWPALLLLALRLRAFETSPLLWIGDRSYAIYLVHYPVLNLFMAAIGPQQADPMNVIALNLAFAVVVFALSDLALRGIERPGRDAVRKLWARHRTARAASPLSIPIQLD